MPTIFCRGCSRALFQTTDNATLSNAEGAIRFPPKLLKLLEQTTEAYYVELICPTCRDVRRFYPPKRKRHAVEG